MRPTAPAGERSAHEIQRRHDRIRGPHDLGAFSRKVWGEPGFHDDTWYGGEDGVMRGAHSDVHGTSAQPRRIMLTIEADDVPASFKEIVALGAGVIAEPHQPDRTGQRVARDGLGPGRQLRPTRVTLGVKRLAQYLGSTKVCST